MYDLLILHWDWTGNGRYKFNNDDYNTIEVVTWEELIVLLSTIGWEIKSFETYKHGFMSIMQISKRSQNGTYLYTQLKYKNYIKDGDND